jgi:(heptosyl)LPS beta-1,4-glucosyltransferase
MDEKPTISISIIGHNEAQNLPQCFESLSWADEIIFVDCESADNSVEIAKKYTNKIRSMMPIFFPEKITFWEVG